MGNFRKLRTVWMAAAMALILPVLPVKAEPAVLADAPSGWALEDVGYAKLYQLTDDGLFGHYQTDVTKGELHQTGLSLLKSLAHRLDNSAVTDAVYREEAKVAPADPAAQATRLDAVETLYQVIAAGNPGLKAVTAAEAQAAYAELKQLDTEAAQAAAYLAASGIVQGRGGEGLQLAAPLSREELLTLSRRTFEWVLQETGVASKGLVWKVSGGKSDVYVLGSIHIGDVTLYPLDKQLQETFGKAGHLAVEANITEDQEGLQYMAAQAVYSDGSTLEQHVSADTYKLFAERMKEAGIAPENYATFKPWYAGLLVQNLSLMEGSAYDAGLGVDMYFLDRAKRTAKPVLEIEGIRFQVDMFNSFSAELQEGMLSSALTPPEGEAQNAEAQQAALNEMLTFWKKGDASSFSKLIESSTEQELEASEFSRVFWHERNKNMAATIKRYLADETGGSYFVVVGAGHLFGKTGVLTELQAAGFETKQLLD